MLSLAITIHNYQGHTLESAVIDLRSSKKICGMSLVSLSCMKKLNNIFLKQFSCERLKTINKSNHLIIIQAALTELDKKFQATKESYHFLWNGQ